MWISAARHGGTHDSTAARDDHVLAHLRAAGLRALADLGFRGLDIGVLEPVIVTGYHATRTHKLTVGQKTASRVLAVGRAPVEQGFAHLNSWRSLTKLRTDPARASHLLCALLVLTNLEVKRWRTSGCRRQPVLGAGGVSGRVQDPSTVHGTAVGGGGWIRSRTWSGSRAALCQGAPRPGYAGCVPGPCGDRFPGVRPVPVRR
ncbi:transposase family protein [Streptomyces griseus]|uniref:transposase family protein n=1 Tax=Streptomyces griseus TaxID=1911 RepID=UPI0036B7AF4E